ncbi:transcriptional regulator domain-containing protein [Sphingobium sp. BS19]|uniref:transcriptional regulator domain-containing protein n=1 Tax=Sphingobium sp. BS19 TaxID=3018973 RepID=UPI0022EF8F91|nr:DUF6499 domain-containing protein [Sphingobium sp. BS19]GLI98007.1 hypothetical protein Sbs19_18250 [Sphingobium sp. BS19]
MAKGETGDEARRQLDLPGFAQEFLRRNPRYRSDYRKVTRQSAREGGTHAREVMARPWGLSFPMRA